MCNDDTYTVLVMIFTLCFDNIIMMTGFIELWHDIIEIDEIHVSIFSAAGDEINAHKVSGTASQRQELLAFCFNVR